MEITLNGVTLASFFQEISLALQFDSNLADGEGLIFGRSSQQTVKITNDVISDTEKNKTTVGIQSFRILRRFNNFYDSQGNLSNSSEIESILQSELSNSQQEILGWFKFRRNSALRPSIRELSIHSNLRKMVNDFTDQKLKNRPRSSQSSVPFVLALFTVNTSKTKATHTYDYRFLNINSQIKAINPIEAHITNLIHSSQTEYNEFTPISPISSDGNDLIKLVNSTPAYLSELEKVFTSTLAQLKNTTDFVYKDMLEIQTLEEEIKKLSSQ